MRRGQTTVVFGVFFGWDSQSNNQKVQGRRSKELTRLGEAAVGAEDEEFHVFVHQLLEGGVCVRAVHDSALVFLVVAGL